MARGQETYQREIMADLRRPEPSATVLLDPTILINLDLQALVIEGGIHTFFLLLLYHIVFLQWNLGMLLYNIGYLLV